jgi:Fe-S cluster biosynthesis and repair protein YggX
MSPAPSPEERIALLRNMVEADPNHELAHFSLGKALLELGDLTAAEASLRRSMELNPRNAAAHLLLGQTLAKAGKRDEAVGVLRTGVLLAHENGEFQPRNRMQELLRSLGVEPPDPAGEERARRGVQAGDFVCARCGVASARLEEVPFDSPVGKKIHETICQGCWREWLGMSIKVINEYRLQLGTDRANQVYEHYMKDFLGIPGA